MLVSISEKEYSFGDILTDVSEGRLYCGQRWRGEMCPSSCVSCGGESSHKLWSLDQGNVLDGMSELEPLDLEGIGQFGKISGVVETENKSSQSKGRVPEMEEKQFILSMILQKFKFFTVSKLKLITSKKLLGEKTTKKQ